MTDQNNAAQAAEQEPLSDEYVNAVIRQHGYGHPIAVAARLWQWIGLHGGENGVTLLIYEAHKALSKLRAEGVQAGDSPLVDKLMAKWDDDGATRGPAFIELRDLARTLERHAALASAPVADDKCPTCNGHGMVGGLTPHSGYDAKPCPDCAPVAGEAREHYVEVRATLQGAHRIMEGLSAIERRVGPVGSHARGYTHKITSALRHLDMLYAAPQASEAVRNQALEALESAQRFIRNGVEFGYIRMPDADTPDSAHHTPGLIDASIRALKTQADRGCGSAASTRDNAACLPVSRKSEKQWDCAKGAGDEREEFEAWLYLGQTEFEPSDLNKDAISLAQLAYSAGRAALSPTPSVVKQSLTATPTGEKGESDA